ncbi:MAG TPA: hypothetical protein VLV18_01335 [Terriglobales bacterium]|nr:hypothetical protein [Terriglobales bacterium]
MPEQTHETPHGVRRKRNGILLEIITVVLLIVVVLFLASEALSFGSVLFQIVVYVTALVFVMLSIVFYDSHRAYDQRQQLIDTLGETLERVPAGDMTKVAAAAINKDKVSEFVDKLIESPEGMVGEGRMAMTLGFIMILGIAMIQLLLTSADLTRNILFMKATTENNATLTYAETTSASLIDIIKTIMTIISGAVTAMIGFYFGARSAEQADTTTQGNSHNQTGAQSDGQTHSSPHR